MWQEENIWLHYVKNIMAADLSSAVFLASFLRSINMTKSYVTALEVIDLQKYKVIKSKNKVRAALGTAGQTPFVFVTGKN